MTDYVEAAPVGEGIQVEHFSPPEEHRFRASGDRTVMEDIVYYAPPFGLLGALANRLVVAAQLRRIFGFRTAAIRQRFGEVS